MGGRSNFGGCRRCGNRKPFTERFLDRGGDIVNMLVPVFAASMLLCLASACTVAAVVLPVLAWREVFG